MSHLALDGTSYDKNTKIYAIVIINRGQIRRQVHGLSLHIRSVCKDRNFVLVPLSTLSAVIRCSVEARTIGEQPLSSSNSPKISDKIEEIVVPTHDVTEVKRGKRIQRKKKIFSWICVDKK